MLRFFKKGYWAFRRELALRGAHHLAPNVRFAVVFHSNVVNSFVLEIRMQYIHVVYIKPHVKKQLNP